MKPKTKSAHSQARLRNMRQNGLLLVRHTANDDNSYQLPDFSATSRRRKGIGANCAHLGCLLSDADGYDFWLAIDGSNLYLGKVIA